MKPRTPGRVILIGCAIDTPPAQAPLHGASTPAVEAVLTAGHGSRESGGTAKMWVNPMRPRHVPHDSDYSEALGWDYLEDAALRGTSSLRYERR
jgi:hypothetical protein